VSGVVVKKTKSKSLKMVGECLVCVPGNGTVEEINRVSDERHLKRFE
jgi:hypothetical protein